MIRKLNWGWGLALMYGGFAVFIIFLVIKTYEINDDLVTPDYYAQELRYQEHLDKLKRTAALPEKPEWYVHGRSVYIKFPRNVLEKNLAATAWLYSPSSAKNDLRFSCSADTAGICRLDLSSAERGVYQLKLDWNAGGVTYYNEGTINIY
ncbi:MAG: FixH family protein [Chitinophagales bacterium]|nr:FixH family protein [Chitinophagales bacterium]MDW8419003.1 FixH family protein [Chitinophagales bacterium]